MRNYFVLLFGFLLGSTACLAQSAAVRICVVQTGSDTPDAAKLAAEFSAHKLLNGTPISGIPVTGRSTKVAEAEVERQSCAFVMKVWRHEAMPNTDPDGANAPTALSRGHSSVQFELRRTGESKTIAKGTGPFPTVYVRDGHRLVTPYPAFAAEVLAKLNHLLVK